MLCRVCVQRRKSCASFGESMMRTVENGIVEDGRIR